jgi:hypothetical protein
MLFFFWTPAVCARGSPENTSGPALIFSGVAGQPGRPHHRPCRMSLLFCLEGKGAWLMLCVQGGRQQTPPARP